MPIELHETVRALRKRAGLTQVQLSEMSGASQSTISELERGRGNITLQMLRAIGSVLNFRVQVVDPDAPSLALGDLSSEDRKMVEMLVEALPKMTARERFAMMAELRSYEQF